MPRATGQSARKPEYNMALCVYDIFPDGRVSIPQDTELTGPGSYRWWHYDLADPSLADWTASHLADIPAQALLQPETRPRCDIYEDGLILNLRGINLNAGQAADQMVSVRMWVTQGVIITVRVRKVFALEELRQTLTEHSPPPSTAAFVTALVERLTARVQDEVSDIAAQAEFFEADLEDETTEPPTNLAVTRRRVIRLRRYLEPQRAALTKLAGIALPLVSPADALRLRELANRSTIAVEELDALQDRLIAVQDEHDQFVARKQARHGHVLSIAAAVFLPLGFLTGLFGVNVAGLPGLQDPYAFIWLCLAMVVVTFGMIVLIKWLRWV